MPIDLNPYGPDGYSPNPDYGKEIPSTPPPAPPESVSQPPVLVPGQPIYGNTGTDESGNIPGNIPTPVSNPANVPPDKIVYDYETDTNWDITDPARPKLVQTESLYTKNEQGKFVANPKSPLFEKQFIQLADGQWINREAFSQLAEKYQEIGKSEGYAKMTEAIKAATERQEAALKQLENVKTDKGYDLAKYLRINQDGEQVLKDAGFRDADIQEARKTNDVQMPVKQYQTYYFEDRGWNYERPKENDYLKGNTGDRKRYYQALQDYDNKLIESANAYIEKYGKGDFIRSGVGQAGSYIVPAARLIQPGAAPLTKSEIIWSAVDAALLVTPFVATKTIRGIATASEYVKGSTKVKNVASAGISEASIAISKADPGLLQPFSKVVDAQGKYVDSILTVKDLQKTLKTTYGEVRPEVEAHLAMAEKQMKANRMSLQEAGREYSKAMRSTQKFDNPMLAREIDSLPNDLPKHTEQIVNDILNTRALKGQATVSDMYTDLLKARSSIPELKQAIASSKDARNIKRLTQQLKTQETIVETYPAKIDKALKNMDLDYPSPYRPGPSGRQPVLAGGPRKGSLLDQELARAGYRGPATGGARSGGGGSASGIRAATLEAAAREAAKHSLGADDFIIAAGIGTGINVGRVSDPRTAPAISPRPTKIFEPDIMVFPPSATTEAPTKPETRPELPDKTINPYVKPMPDIPKPYRSGVEFIEFKMGKAETSTYEGTEPATESKSGSKSGTQPGTGTKGGTETAPDSGTTSGPTTGTGTKTQPGQDTKTYNPTQPETVTQPAPGTAPKLKPAPKLKTLQPSPSKNPTPKTPKTLRAKVDEGTEFSEDELKKATAIKAGMGYWFIMGNRKQFILTEKIPEGIIEKVGTGKGSGYASLQAVNGREGQAGTLDLGIIRAVFAEPTTNAGQVRPAYIRKPTIARRPTLQVESMGKMKYIKGVGYTRRNIRGRLA